MFVGCLCGERALHCCSSALKLTGEGAMPGSNLTSESIHATVSWTFEFYSALVASVR